MVCGHKEELTAMFDFILGNETKLVAMSWYCAKGFIELFMILNLICIRIISFSAF